MEFIREASKICKVSLGHSAAGYGAAMEAFRAGAGHVTHLFNAMPPLHHREPGIIGAALDSGATAELICDGLHIHPSAVRAASAAAVAAAGLDAGVLAPGRPADLVLLDSELNIQAVFIDEKFFSGTG